MKALHKLLIDTERIERIQALADRYTKMNQQFSYAGHRCCFVREELMSLEIFHSPTSSYYKMDDLIIHLGSNCYLKNVEAVDTLDLVAVKHINNPQFFDNFTNLRVLIANSLTSFPSPTCLKYLKKLKYIEVEMMAYINAELPESVRIVKSLEAVPDFV